VEATGSGEETSAGEGAAGIDGGHRQTGGNITIDGGTVTATGNTGSAGIGGGKWGYGGTITLTGGTIIATGYESGAGIGGGYAGTGGEIKINYPSGSSTGTAKNELRGRYYPGPAIGPGVIHPDDHYSGSGGSYNGVENNWPPATESEEHDEEGYPIHRWYIWPDGGGGSNDGMVTSTFTPRLQARSPAASGVTRPAQAASTPSRAAR